MLPFPTVNNELAKVTLAEVPTLIVAEAPIPVAIKVSVFKLMLDPKLITFNPKLF